MEKVSWIFYVEPYLQKASWIFYVELYLQKVSWIFYVELYLQKVSWIFYVELCLQKVVEYFKYRLSKELVAFHQTVSAAKVWTQWQEGKSLENVSDWVELQSKYKICQLLHKVRIWMQENFSIVARASS